MSSTVRRRGRPDPSTSASNAPLLPEKDKTSEEGEFGREHWTVLAVLVVFLVGSVSHFHTCLPVPKQPNRGDAGDISYPIALDNSEFSEVRARTILKELSDYGPKPAGSDVCEGLTRNRILEEVR